MTDHDLEQLVRRYADDVRAELGYDPTVGASAGRDLDELERLIDGVSQSIALAADHDVEQLAAVEALLEGEGLGGLLAFSAHAVAAGAYRSDADRAAHLAALVNAGMPPSPQAFAPRHARLAAEQVDDVNRRLWLLDDFVGVACSLT